jgi:hypothetical protein
MLKDVGFMWKGKAHFIPCAFHFDKSPCSVYVNVNEQSKEIKVFIAIMDGIFIHRVITETGVNI